LPQLGRPSPARLSEVGKLDRQVEELFKAAKYYEAIPLATARPGLAKATCRSRRGFVQAGAQNLLMTLWPISDETTVQIMLDFYDASFKNGNAPQALADTQRDWLRKLRKERGLLDAVRLAGPFIMSSRGKP